MSAPTCPVHQRVMSTSNRGDAFFCSAKDPNGRNGYCTYRVPIAAAPVAPYPLPQAVAPASAASLAPESGAAAALILMGQCIRAAATMVPPEDVLPRAIVLYRGARAVTG